MLYVSSVRFILQVLKREIPWETYMTAKMIQGTDLMLLRRYDHRGPEVQSQLLNQVGRQILCSGLLSPRFGGL